MSAPVHSERIQSSDIGPRPFSSAWWVEFDRRTTLGKSPYLFKYILPSSFPGPEEIDDVVRNLQKAKDTKRRLRLYTRQELREDLVEKVLSSKYAPGPVFPQICSTAGTEQVAIIINDLHDRSEALTRSVGRILNSMYEVRGAPCSGAELALYAGCYEGPLGARRSDGHAFLFHIGPASKAFHLWSPERFEKLTENANEVSRWQALVNDSTSVTLEPGDALYIPARWYHVGVSPSYSCSVVLDMYNHPISGWLRGTLPQLLDNLSSEYRESYMMGGPNSNPWGESVQELAERILRTELPKMLNDEWYRRMSNAGFLAKLDAPFPRLGLCERDAVRVKTPFQICWSQSAGSDHMDVFLRHRHVRLPDHPAMPKLFRMLNAGAVLTLWEFIGTLADQWGVDTVLDAMDELSGTGGLERAEP